MNNRFKRVLAGIVTFAVFGVTAAVPALAADKTDTGTGSVTGNVTINGSISPLTISVTHPINVAYAQPRGFQKVHRARHCGKGRLRLEQRVQHFHPLGGERFAVAGRTLNPNTSGALSLTADYGLAFDGAYTANHQLVFQFQLA